ncbi:30S ribosomal protein S17 [candidate division Kazan bacterium RIFCSPHIGHO2_01_FULL_49_10]|uniref:Small ribosomal subunit protein uS17 n=1 Tax=candidate division Kazan bacterium RIFCSPLOWO2_01_FULL_48_13 TaxID=1798539 RepID=A0A1F4PPZ2_UNCK3|nr:MAG: 30S ribosomal protein S17 [candidate division Kazan bacterium RIFCSPHIGHO2_01_FULL_49_10]OGB85650.1 MAG: 30S ribosomal protein S17 [candidate division Kazan bacterium RIFCSPLOWO2_01_FULL_48_13]
MNKHKQRKTGRVVSTQMQSTIVVSVDTLMSHPLYRKKIRKTKRFLAHDPKGEASLGDTVIIEETRPISKLKRWLVVEVKKEEKLTDVAAVEEALS